MEMRFVTIDRESYIEPGVIADDGEVIGLRDAGLGDLTAVMRGGEDAMDRVRRWIDNPPGHSRLDPAAAKLVAPIPRPSKIICIGLNYRDHAEESKMAIPEVPTVFSKYATAVIGPGAPIVLPRVSQKPDYEAE